MQKADERRNLNKFGQIFNKGLQIKLDLKRPADSKPVVLIVVVLRVNSPIRVEVQVIPVIRIVLSTTPIVGVGGLIVEGASVIGVAGIKIISFLSVN